MSNPFKTTQLKTAIVYTFIFAASVALLSWALVIALADQIEGTIEARVLRTRDTLLMTERRFGLNELANVVSDEADSVGDVDSVLLLIDEKRNVVAGNVRVPSKMIDGWQELTRLQSSGASGDANLKGRFYVVWTILPKGMIMVGRSDREARQSRAILIKNLGWGVLLTVVIAVGTGLYLASGTQRRVDQIASALRAVSSGDLEKRIELRGTGDDLDEVAGNINSMLSQLQRLVENVNQVSTDIAHDLKKPMMRLRARLESTHDQPGLPEEVSHNLGAALDAVDSVVATFDAMLNIGQLQAGDRRTRFTSVNLTAVVDHMIEAYEAVIQDSGFILAKSDTPPQVFVKGDRELLAQLLANLIDNVLRHTPLGTELQIGLALKGRSCKLVVADNGPGIPEDERENVLRRFYRLERARSTPGHGLGLSVVSAIAELHGATFVLTDNKPGCRATIRLDVLSNTI